MRVDDPVALARVHWRSDESTPPEAFDCVASTAVFVLGEDSEVVPGWPATGEHFSVMLEFLGSVSPAGQADAKVDFLARREVAQYLHEGAQFLLMAGPLVIADVEVTKVLWSDEN